MGKKSVVWINMLKGLCIVTVFLVHTQSYYGMGLRNANFFFHTFYVNAFFFVSGYLLFWKQLSEPRILEDKKAYIKGAGGGKLLFFNIVYRIVIPSTIFSAIEIFPNCIIQGREIDLVFILYKTIGGGTYWFTSALVVAEMILLTLFCSRRRNMWFYVAVCVVLGIVGLIISRLETLGNGIWAWRQGQIALVFLAMGGLYWRYENQIDKMMKWWFTIPCTVIYWAMVILLKDYTDPLISTLTIQPLGFVTSAMACLLLVWLCKKSPEMKPLSFIGKNSLGFYFMSGALPITFSLMAHKLVSGSYTWLLLGIWVTCLLAAYITVMIINKWLPWMWDLRQLRKPR